MYKHLSALTLEPSEEAIYAARDAWRSVKTSAVCGMTIEAQFKAEFVREIAALRAAYRVDAIGSLPAVLAEAEARGRLAGLEEAAGIVDFGICDVAEDQDLFMAHRDYFAAAIRAAKKDAAK